MSAAPNAFDEGFNDTEHADPLAPKHQDFDFQAIYTAIDGEDPEADEDKAEQIRAGVAAAFKRVGQFCADINLDHPNADRLLGRRLLAVLWVTNPDFFAGKSLARLAVQLGVAPKSIQRHSAEVSRKFGIVNRGMAHGWSRGQKLGARKGTVTHEP